MTNQKLISRIQIDPTIAFGKPRIKGTRITVEDIFDYLAGGTSESELLELFPKLKKEDIKACYAYAANNESGTLNIVLG